MVISCGMRARWYGMARTPAATVTTTSTLREGAVATPGVERANKLGFMKNAGQERAILNLDATACINR